MNRDSSLRKRKIKFSSSEQKKYESMTLDLNL